jgi:hypothetical protein
MKQAGKTYGMTVLVHQTRAVPKRAATVARALHDLNQIFLELFSDEHFVTLLRAESMTTVPAHLGKILDETRNRNEIA